VPRRECRRPALCPLEAEDTLREREPLPRFEAYAGRVDLEAPDAVAGDAEGHDGDLAAEHAPERPVDRFRRTAAGSVVAAGLFGLRDALEGRPEKEEVTIVSEAPEEPVDDDYLLVFDKNLPPGMKVVLPRPPDHEQADGPS
jgi:hypothetical protein